MQKLDQIRPMIYRKLRAMGVKVRAWKTYRQFSGEYDYTKKLVCYSTNPKRSETQIITTLLHEANHAVQDHLGLEKWVRAIKLEEKADCHFFEWLEGDKELPPSMIRKITNAVMNLEAECERMTVLDLATYDLTKLIDKEQYIRQANAYILFYRIAEKHRKFYMPSRAPYLLPEVLEKVPGDEVISHPEDYSYKDVKFLEACLP